MSLIKRSVIVLHLPAEITPLVEVDVLHRLRLMMGHASRARFALNCSKVENFGPRELDFLICCLEEVMKGDGDLRLTEIHPVVCQQLTELGVAALLEPYDYAPKTSAMVA